MPWECVQRNRKWLCVEKGNSDNVKGTHDSKGACEAQVRALYANYKPEKR